MFPTGVTGRGLFMESKPSLSPLSPMQMLHQAELSCSVVLRTVFHASLLALSTLEKDLSNACSPWNLTSLSCYCCLLKFRGCGSCWDMGCLCKTQLRWSSQMNLSVLTASLKFFARLPEVSWKLRKFNYYSIVAQGETFTPWKVLAWLQTMWFWAQMCRWRGKCSLKVLPEIEVLM